MTVTRIENHGQFQIELNKAGMKVTVVDFMATWCGPCHAISPFFHKLPERFPGAVFLQVDVDVCRETAAQYGVRAMPTFLFFRNSEKIDQMSGADPRELEEKVKLHAGAATTVVEEIPGHIDLVTYINKGGSECLNESDDHTMNHAVQNEGGYLESDCDEQLIMSIAFQQPVKLHSLKLQAPDDKGPKTIKLFINQPRTLDFDQADSMEPTQLIEVDKKDLVSANLLPLRYVKFQNVHSLLIFVKDNQAGTDTTQIDRLTFIGCPLNATNMGDFKRVSGKKGESE